MIQLLETTQDYDAFESALPQPMTYRRSGLEERQSNQECSTPDRVVMKTTDRMKDYLADRRTSQVEVLFSSLAAIFFGAATIAFGYFLLNVV